MDLVSLGLRIKTQREKLGMSQTELAYKIGFTSRSSITKLEKGMSDISRAKLEMCAKALQVSPAYLMGWEDTPNKGDNFRLLTPTVATYDVIGKVKAGYNGEAYCEMTGEQVQVPIASLHGQSESNYFVLAVSGMSMYPTLLEGDKILVKRTESVDSGKIAVILYKDDEATVKKVVYEEGKPYMDLIPINPAYAPLRIENEDLNHCKVLGEVTQLIRNF